MPSIIQRNFAGGEVAPAVFGRADVVKYQTGLRQARNFLVRRHGGVSNRPGSQYITPQRDHSLRGRLIKFVFNADQTYMLLFEHLTMRVIQNGVLLTVPNATAWSGATNYVIGDVALEGGVNYYCILGHTNQVPPNATYWYAMPAGNIYEIPTPYASTSLPVLYRSQSGDVVTLTNTANFIYDLSRTGHTTWVFTQVVMVPAIAAPATLTHNKVDGTLTQWVATAVKLESYEESEPSVVTGTTTAPTAAVPITLTIGTVTGALEYNVYKNEGSGIYGFIGVSKAGTFKDPGIPPNYDLTPPMPRDPFVGAALHPACSGYLQQRKCYGGLPDDPESLYGSKTGQYKNFGTSSPLKDNDAITYPIASREVNEIRHIIEVMESFILTSGVEWVAQGGTDGQLTPNSPGLKPKSYYGSSEVPPVIVGENVLFVQARGNVVRDLNYDATTKGYSGRDLSVFAPHLFAGTTIEHWDYAQIPDSMVWAQQDDGFIAVLTYLREHEVWGWAPQDTDGDYEDVAVIPEGAEDAVYVLVNRTISGATKRYVERFASRRVTNVEVDALFLDSYLTYDGRNTTATTMTLSGGTSWLHTESLTLTASAAFFVAGDVGNAIRLTIETTTWTPEDGTVTTREHLILNIMAYTSPTDVTVNATKTVPVAFRDVMMTNWAKGVDEFAGADHLEGESIAILADGNVLKNGIDAPLMTVSGGIFTLDRPYFVVHAGLPYCSDLETLDLELVGGETLLDKQKLVNQVTLLVEDSRGIWAGSDAAHLFEYKQRSTEAYGVPLPLMTRFVTVPISAAWNKGGRVFVRQKDPLPLSVLNVIPNVEIGG